VTASASAGTARAKAPPSTTASPRGDTNLHELAGHVESPLFLAHLRATSGTAVQQTNCQHGRWLFVHNGVLAGFHQMRRDLVLAVDPALFADFVGSTDSEVVFRLALTFGLEEDPVGALERAIGFVEATAARHGVEHAVQGSFGVSDGIRLWAFRYSTEGRSRTLFASGDAHTLRQLHPENPRLQQLATETGSWSRSPSPSCPACGTRFPRRASWSSSQAMTSCARSARTWSGVSTTALGHCALSRQGAAPMPTRNSRPPAQAFEREPEQSGSRGVLALAAALNDTESSVRICC